MQTNNYPPPYGGQIPNAGMPGFVPSNPGSHVNNISNGVQPNFNTKPFEESRSFQPMPPYISSNPAYPTNGQYQSSAGPTYNNAASSVSSAPTHYNKGERLPPHVQNGNAPNQYAPPTSGVNGVSSLPSRQRYPAPTGMPNFIPAVANPSIPAAANVVASNVSSSGYQPQHPTGLPSTGQLSGHRVNGAAIGGYYNPNQVNNNAMASGHAPGPAYPSVPNTFGNPNNAGHHNGAIQNFQSGPGPVPAMPGAYHRQAAPAKPDLSMMPSAVNVMMDDQVRSGIFPTGFPAADAPPLVSTDFYSQDQGNCNPRLMRSTLYCAPASKDLLKTSLIPFAVACSPFARLHKNEQPLPVVDSGVAGPVRCARCKAYICPFMEFEDGGRKFRCPFCSYATPVDEVYFAHLDHTGRRSDVNQRPELFYGAYDFTASKEYCKNGVSPKQPAFIFMIDVSYNAIQNGMVNVLCRNLENILENLPRELNQTSSSVRVGLATFDQAVHFYDLSSDKPSMKVIGDVSEMFSPMADGMMLPYTEAAAAIRAVLNEIPKLFCQTRVTETILGPVISAGMNALQSAERVGKLFLFSTSLPRYDAPGKLKEKNERNLLGTEKEKTALLPQSNFYRILGEECVKSGVSVDFFLFPSAFIDVATIAEVATVTGGSVYKYNYFNSAKDSDRFVNDLKRNIGKQIGFDCVVKIRSSSGIRPVSFNGSFYMDKAGDLEFASLDEDKMFFAELKHDDTLREQNAVIQTAVLYTSLSGQRRLRILNLCLEVAADYTRMYRMADQDTIIAYLMKTALQLNLEKGNAEMKEFLGENCATMLRTFREKCSNHTPLHQIVLPETLKLLPLYVNSIAKNDAVSGGSEMTVDEKAWMAGMIRSLKVPDILKVLYPSVYPVSHLELQSTDDAFEMPAPIRASFEFLNRYQAYLIDNGMVLFLWIGLCVSAEWLSDVFGASSVALLDVEQHIIPERDNRKSRGLRKAVGKLDVNTRKRKLFIIREKDALEPWMKKFLVEDKASHSSPSYVDYLIYMHRQIREYLT